MATLVLQLVSAVSVAVSALLLSSPAFSHVGHGDEFQAQGNVRQVKANTDTDALLGVVTEKPQLGPTGLTVPMAAVVDADGKPLVFVKSATTYDPVFVETGDSSGDRVTIAKGISADEDVVVQGGLSLYAESKKSQQSDTTKLSAAPAGSALDRAATPSDGPQSQLNPVAIGAAVLGVLALGGVAASTVRRKAK